MICSLAHDRPARPRINRESLPKLEALRPLDRARGGISFSGGGFFSFLFSLFLFSLFSLNYLSGLATNKKK